MSLQQAPALLFWFFHKGYQEQQCFTCRISQRCRLNASPYRTQPFPEHRAEIVYIKYFQAKQTDTEKIAPAIGAISLHNRDSALIPPLHK